MLREIIEIKNGDASVRHLRIQVNLSMLLLWGNNILDYYSILVNTPTHDSASIV